VGLGTTLESSFKGFKGGESGSKFFKPSNSTIVIEVTKYIGQSTLIRPSVDFLGSLEGMEP
jgi:hypothetical protein